MKHLIIIGARGFGREMYWSATEAIGYKEEFDIKGYLDDKTDALDGYKNYPPILGPVESYQVQPDDVFVCALGDVRWRKHYTEIILGKGGRFMSLIHKTAYISPNAVLGNGCVILAGARIHCDVTLGDYVTVQPYAIIGHDVTVGDWTLINALADCGGFSRIGRCVTMHTTSFCLPKSRIDDNATVGAGSVVLRKVGEGETVMGVPAKRIPLPK